MTEQELHKEKGSLKKVLGAYDKCVDTLWSNRIL